MFAARRFFIGLFLALCACAAHAGGELFKLPTRPGVQTSVFWEARDGAAATVLLFPGGGGGFGKLENGRPSGRNFLVRSAGYFLDQGFNVAIIGKPSDSKELDFADRIGDAHIADIHAVLDFIKTKSSVPVWLVGTSRGTISATAAAIRLPDAGIAGLVLTSSIVSYSKPGAVPRQDLEAIRIPVLVLHHERDACALCHPYEVGNIMRGLKNAPVKKQIMASGGAGASGDPCEAQHWHGFVGMEQEAVGIIADWIRHPVS